MQRGEKRPKNANCQQILYRQRAVITERFLTCNEEICNKVIYENLYFKISHSKQCPGKGGNK